MEDTPKTHKRRMREMKTISQMVALHCAENHSKADRVFVSHSGEPICGECKALDEYAVLRTQRCRQMESKTSCEECGNHCYKPEMREKIRAVMRYSGPRMLGKHPVAAIRHLLGR